MRKCLSAVLFVCCLVQSVSVAAETITNAELDMFLACAPKISATINRIRNQLNKEAKFSERLSTAQVEGNYMREMLRLVREWPEYPALEKAVKGVGFETVDAWSFVADRVLGVIMSANYVVLTGSLAEKESESPALNVDTNIFTYLNDESNDPVLRMKFRDQLQEVCEKLCYDTADLLVVGARYEELQAALDAM